MKKLMLLAVLLLSLSLFSNEIVRADGEVQNPSSTFSSRGYNVYDKVMDIPIVGQVPGSGEEINSTLYGIIDEGKAIYIFWGATW